MTDDYNDDEEDLEPFEDDDQDDDDQEEWVLFETVSDWQAAVNSGLVWRLEGHVGRTTMQALHAGHLMLGHHGVQDYWGNYVPSRDEIKADTFGSPSYVEKHRGVEHRELLERVNQQ